MSKKLNSILDRLPHATAQNATLPSSQSIEKIEVKSESESEKMVRIVAPVPLSLKKELKRYVIENPGETEKALILRGLRALGFKVADAHIEDQRRKS